MRAPINLDILNQLQNAVVTACSNPWEPLPTQMMFVVIRFRVSGLGQSWHSGGTVYPIYISLNQTKPEKCAAMSKNAIKTNRWMLSRGAWSLFIHFDTTPINRSQITTVMVKEWVLEYATHVAVISYLSRHQGKHANQS